MGVLLARSENQILVLETLLKRLVQVCVHTQDKRLAKELKLMDFTRLVRRYSYYCVSETIHQNVISLFVLCELSGGFNCAGVIMTSEHLVPPT